MGYDTPKEKSMEGLGIMMKSEDIAKYIDHTLLASNATEDKVVQLCKEAMENSFASVCDNSKIVFII